MPLKKAAENHIKENYDFNCMSDMNAIEDNEYSDTSKLLISFQTDFDRPNRYSAFRCKDKIIIPKNTFSTFISNTSDFSEIDSVEIIQEGNAVLEAEDLQTLISTVLKLINK